ncbi:MAG TPA: hypothetical protein ENG58_04510 [Thermotogales bacterium]|nr:hypothetical protein [Thermotogales bacterium]
MKKAKVVLIFICIFFVFLFLQSCGFIPQKLCAPSNLEIIEVGPDHVILSWRDNTISEDGFEIFRKAVNEESFRKVGTVGMNSEVFEDLSVLPSRKYTYKIRAFKGGTFSDFSEPVDVVTLEPYPNPPEQLKVLDKTESSIKLTWLDRSNNEKGFRIFRSFDGERYDLLVELPMNTNIFEDRNLPPGTICHYYVTAFNDSGSSGKSNIIVVQTNEINDPPTNLKPLFPTNGSMKVNFTTVTLRWDVNDPNGDELIYDLYFGTDPIPPLKAKGLSVPQYVLSNLRPGTTYYWKIGVYDKHGNMVYGSIWTFKTKLNVPPSPPSDLRAVSVSSTEIELRWKDNSDNETGFEISRSSLSWTGYTKIGEVGENITVFRDSSLITGRQYCYKVRSKNEFGSSQWVGPVCAVAGGKDP